MLLPVLEVKSHLTNDALYYILLTEFMTSDTSLFINRGTTDRFCRLQEQQGTFSLTLQYINSAHFYAASLHTSTQQTACHSQRNIWVHSPTAGKLTLRLLMSYIYIYIAPSKARNANVVYIWTYVWQR